MAGNVEAVEMAIEMDLFRLRGLLRQEVRRPSLTVLFGLVGLRWQGMWSVGTGWVN